MAPVSRDAIPSLFLTVVAIFLAIVFKSPWTWFALVLVVAAVLVAQWTPSPLARGGRVVAVVTGVAGVLLLVASFSPLLKDGEAPELDIDERLLSVIAPGRQVIWDEAFTVVVGTVESGIMGSYKLYLPGRIGTCEWENRTSGRFIYRHHGHYETAVNVGDGAIDGKATRATGTDEGVLEPCLPKEGLVRQSEGLAVVSSGGEPDTDEPLQLSLEITEDAAALLYLCRVSYGAPSFGLAALTLETLVARGSSADLFLPSTLTPDDPLDLKYAAYCESTTSPPTSLFDFGPVSLTGIDF